MDILALSSLRQRVDDVRWRPGLRVPAPQVDEVFTSAKRGGGYSAKERSEVLLRKPVQSLGLRRHRAIVLRELQRSRPRTMYPRLADPL